MIALNLLDRTVIHARMVEQLPRVHAISLCTGCFCNPGAAKAAFGIAEESLVRAFKTERAMSCDELAAAMGVTAGCAVRVSVGAATDFGDACAFLEFARPFLDTVSDARDLPAWQQ
jgi:hypothetical protein